MSHSFGKPRHRHERRPRRGRELRHAHAESDADEDAELTPEERALRAAHAKAERKTQLAGDALWFLGVTVALFVFVPPIGVIVMLVWGLKLAKEAYELELEPQLRKRFIDQEAEKLVHASLSQQRRDLEGAHAKSLEQLSASIAHENVEYARVALEELQRVERSVSHLLRFAREADTGMTLLDMSDVVESALESFRDRAARIGVAIESQIDCAGSMFGDAEQLRRVVINLVGNALEALDESVSANPRIEVRMGENLAGSEVWVRIKDNGPGIDSEAVSKLFSPFYTSRANGTGLGLSISKKIVDAHGGDIEVASAPGEGAEFLLTFPKRPVGAGAVS